MQIINIIPLNNAEIHQGKDYKINYGVKFKSLCRLPSLNSTVIENKNLNSTVDENWRDKIIKSEDIFTYEDKNELQGDVLLNKNKKSKYKFIYMKA